jgi:hypothetical protein
MNRTRALIARARVFVVLVLAAVLSSGALPALKSGASYARSRAFDQHGWIVGALGVDPSPCWNRDGAQLLFPSIADDSEGTRLLFLIRLVAEGAPLIGGRMRAG